MLRAGSAPSAVAAGRLFRQQHPDPVFVVLRPARGCCVRIVVPEGVYALVEKAGAAHDHPATGGAVWPAGAHWVGPMTYVAHLVRKSEFELRVAIKGCVTKDSVLLQVDVLVSMRVMGDAARGEDPGLVRKFVYELSPRGLQEQVVAALEESLRTQARSAAFEPPMLEAAGGWMADAQRSLDELLSPRGVQVTRLVVAGVELAALAGAALSVGAGGAHGQPGQL